MLEPKEATRLIYTNKKPKELAIELGKQLGITKKRIHGHAQGDPSSARWYEGTYSIGSYYGYYFYVDIDRMCAEVMDSNLSPWDGKRPREIYYTLVHMNGGEDVAKHLEDFITQNGYEKK